MGLEFLRAVWFLKALSARHQVMALFAAQQWSLEKLKDESLNCDTHTPDLMVLGEPPPEIAASHVEPDKVLN